MATHESTVQNAEINPNAILSTIRNTMQELFKDRLDTRLDKFENTIKTTINTQSAKISSMQNQIAQLQSKNSEQETVINALFKEVREKNLCLSGVPDASDETSEQLMQKVCKIISDITKNNIIPATAFRCGKFRSEQNRKIRIKFESIRDRDSAFNNKDKLKHPIYLNEDISQNEAHAQKLLRDRRKELSKAGTTCSIDYKTLSIKAEDGTPLAEVRNGRLVHVLKKPVSTKRSNPGEPSNHKTPCSDDPVEPEGKKQKKDSGNSEHFLDASENPTTDQQPEDMEQENDTPLME